MERGTQYSRELAMLRDRKFIMTQTTQSLTDPDEVLCANTVYQKFVHHHRTPTHWRHKEAPVVEAVAPQL